MTPKQAALPGFGGLVKTAKQSRVTGKRGRKLSCWLNGPRYLAIRLASVETDKKHQQILVEAFDLWMERYEAERKASQRSVPNSAPRDPPSLE